MLGFATVMLLAAAAYSVAWDVCTHDHRQDKWAKAHPGQTYVRNYRKITGT